MPKIVIGVAWLVLGVGTFAAASAQPADHGDEPRVLLWGDTHLHTSYSFDAFLNNNHTADPDVAYRFAKGAPVIHPYTRTRVQIETPLDFLVVSDHAEFIGGIRAIYDRGIPDEDAGLLQRLLNWYYEGVIRDAVDSGKAAELFASLLPDSEDAESAASSWGEVTEGPLPPMTDAQKDAWAEITRIADAHNRPGRFTALIGWEWSSTPGGANLHRIVVSDADGATARQFQPFGSDQSPYPEDLWDWLEQTSARTGANFVAIPHNSNVSKGRMFDTRTLAGDPLDAEMAATRLRWEPVVEVTQIKGDSETHPAFSPEDEFADFELYPYYLQQHTEPYHAHPGDFVRPALKTGLALAEELGVNPFQFGLIGSTDSHTGLSSAEEPNFWGKMATDSIPENKAAKALADGPTGWSMSAAGLAAVWAEANTRESILAALRRREVYATTGPRIRVHVAASWAALGGATAEQDSVPMGGVMPSPPEGALPRFDVSALRDPKSANLDRIQIVKGWLDGQGKTQERVFDVAWSGDRDPGPDGRLPPVGDSVDRATGAVTDEIGAAELTASWTDRDFDPAQRAFYYVRVLQVPTARHSFLDGLALGLDESPEGPDVIQERAYTSPVWYSPTGS